MEISSKSVKISAHFELPLEMELESGQDYLVGLEGQIAKKSDTPEEDGTESRCWTIRAIKGQIGAKAGKSIALKDKKGQSFRLRTIISREFDMDYETSMNALMSDTQALREFIEKQRF